MRRFARRMLNENQLENSTDERYLMAYKRVKRIKGFYVHLMVYILVNTFIICGNYYENSSNNQVFLRWDVFSTALFWGIGLVAHGLSVFGRNIFFSHDWEEKKIQEFMKKENSEKWE